MVFGFLKRLNSPEGGYRSIRASYDKHYQLALRNGIEPVSMGLFGALGSRYKVRGLFVSDLIHMVEITPFAVMDEMIRVKELANYLMADEIPDQIDISAVRSSINDAISTAPLDNSCFELLAGSEPYLSSFPIRWVPWLTEANRQRIRDAHEAQE